MSEKAKAILDQIAEKVQKLPEEVASDALSQYAAHLEGFAEGYAAGQKQKEAVAV